MHCNRPPGSCCLKVERLRFSEVKYCFVFWLKKEVGEKGVHPGEYVLKKRRVGMKVK